MQSIHGNKHSALDLRERGIYKLAFVAGVRPREIFGLKQNRIHGFRAEIVQRVPQEG
jgi:hypothetical protein